MARVGIPNPPLFQIIKANFLWLLAFLTDLTACVWLLWKICFDFQR